MIKIVSTCMTFTTLFFANPEVYAQANAQANAQQTYSRSKFEFASEKLTQMVELPEVPQYTGQAVFVSGTRFPNAKSGASMTLLLRAIEYPAQIKEWYTAALQQSGWKLETLMCNERTVAASKGKRLCQVIVAPPSHPRFRCDLKIRYRDGS